MFEGLKKRYSTNPPKKDTGERLECRKSLGRVKGKQPHTKDTPENTPTAFAAMSTKWK
jgi:hypothetical protein